MDRFAALVTRGRWLLIAGWVAATVACVFALPNLEQAQTGALGDLVPANAKALDAEVRSAKLFGFPLLSRTLVVERNDGGLSATALTRLTTTVTGLNRGTLPGLRDVAGALPVVNALGSQPFAREEGTTAVLYLFFRPEVKVRQRTALAHRVAARLSGPGAGYVGVTGALGARSARSDAISRALPLVELGTVLLVLLAVGLHFRAVLAPLLCLGVIGVAYLVSIRAVAGIGQAAGISVPAEVQPVIIVLIFGVVTDYTIFYLSRFRRALVEEPDHRRAATRTAADLSGIVLTAGLAVAGGAAALVVAELGFFRAFGPGLAIAVLIAVTVALTLVPAALAVLGRALFWPNLPQPAGARASTEDERVRPQRRRRLRSGLARLAARRPKVVVAAATAFLLAGATGVLFLEVGQTLIRGLPAGSEPRVAYAQAARGFAPGILSPSVVLAEQPGLTRRRAGLQRLQREIETEPGVAAVVGPADQPFQRRFGAVYSRAGDAARLFVVFDSDPLGARAIADLRRLRDRLPALSGRAGLPAGTTTSLAGDTALAEEVVSDAGSDLGRVAPAVLLVVLIVLSVFLRALVAPLYLVAASVLALAAALGITTILFQFVLGHHELTFYVPFAAAVLLVSLGSDYNAFLAGEIWHAARRRPLRDAVEVGAARAATPVTVAGIVLALSFALLAVVPLQPFRELAVAMTIGLLLDALLVRTLLVPALVALVGTASGWPSRRLLPRSALPRPPEIDVGEPAATASVASTAEP